MEKFNLFIVARGLLVSAAILFVSGCVTAEQYASIYAGQRPATQQERALVLDHLRTSLFDPYSVRDARISNVLFPSRVIASSRNDKAICVRLNAKNRFGAYIGLSYFMLKYAPDGTLLSSDNSSIAQSQCADQRLGYAAFDELERL